MIKINLFERLPHYFKSNDTYKNAEGKGILQRYLQVIEDYLMGIFDQLAKVWGNQGTIVNPQETEDQYLPYIADYYGNPPYINEEPDYMYKSMLRHIVTIYHWRGTGHFFEVLFKYYGLTIYMNEVFDDTLNYVPRYDRTESNTPLVFDDEGTHYDVSDECLNCSGANVYIKTLISTDAKMVDRVLKILDLYRPINAIFYVRISSDPDAEPGDDSWIYIAIIDSEGIHYITEESNNLLEHGIYYNKDKHNNNTNWRYRP